MTSTRDKAISTICFTAAAAIWGFNMAWAWRVGDVGIFAFSYGMTTAVACWWLVWKETL